jgi:hypothetical protein
MKVVAVLGAVGVGVLCRVISLPCIAATLRTAAPLACVGASALSSESVAANDAAHHARHPWSG